MRESFRFLSPRFLPGPLVLALAISSQGTAADAPTSAAADRIAVAVVFDTSGSMKQPFGRKDGKSPASAEPKYRVAQRAFEQVIKRLETFAKTPGAKPLAIGVYVFKGEQAAVAEPIAPFDAARLRRWLNAIQPESATPLGNALFLAGRDLLATPAASRHLLVVTDGENTNGRKPEDALAAIQQAAGKKEKVVFAHIIALDIPPRVFASLQQQGATLIGAADEAQLNTQFDFILEEKILVEAPR
jgi:hypothetical protein